MAATHEVIEISSSSSSNEEDGNTSHQTAAPTSGSDGYMYCTTPPDRSSQHRRDEDEVSDDLRLGSSSSDEDDSYSDVGMTIDFIREKQMLLKRASFLMRNDEENYDASQALRLVKRNKPNTTTTSETTRMTDDLTSSSIWAEAKEVLIALSQKAGEMVEFPEPATTSSLSTQQSRPKRAFTSPKSPKDPSIDTSSVRVISSSEYGVASSSTEESEDEGIADSGYMTRTLQPLVVPMGLKEGQWMAQALQLSNRSASASAKGGQWQMFSDPLSSSKSLIPPRTSSSMPMMRHAISLQDAISVTNEPRIVTQSAPPFLIVHVNRAFLKIAAAGDHHEQQPGNNEKVPSLIGRPVESILQRTPDLLRHLILTSNHDNSSDSLQGEICLGTPTNSSSKSSSSRPCFFQTVPVVDRSRRFRASCCISHVLIRVQELMDTSTLASSAMRNYPDGSGRRDSSLGTVG